MLFQLEVNEWNFSLSVVMMVDILIIQFVCLWTDINYTDMKGLLHMCAVALYCYFCIYLDGRIVELGHDQHNL